MKISPAASGFLALCAAQATVAFVVHGPASSAGRMIASTSALFADSYSYTYGGSSQSSPASAKTQGSSAPDQGRVTALEKAVEKRIAALSEREKALEARLAAVERSSSNKSGKPATLPSSDEKSVNRIWETSPQIRVQGGSLRTWSFANPTIQRVHVLMKTDGRPLDADIDLWQGPDNTPHRMRVYVEDGALRPFCAFVDTPGSPNTIAVRNIGHLEFPLDACVGTDLEAGSTVLETVTQSDGETIQGGALRTYGFDPSVDSVAILLTTDGRPLNSRIELLQGPNNNKQVIELYTEDGMERPFLAVFQTPGSGNVVRVVNTAPVEFPLVATVVAYEIGNSAFWSQDEEGVIMANHL